METTGIPVAKVSPRFLHASSTSHTWPFSAVAELIDNAYDPDVAAADLNINVREISGLTCLVFEDNGGGMDHEHLLKMLSFGYSEDSTTLGPAFHLPTNRYGNGFKSGSMRLAKDALVFTVCQKSAGIGFLSRTYLETIRADSILVPVLEYSLPNMEKINPQKSRNSLAAILRHSPFKTEKVLKEELQAIRDSTRTGTKIILYNLKRLKDGSFELDFESDDFDIRFPEAHAVDRTSVYHRTSRLETAEYVQSLRKYCKILYLNPLMKIFIREKEVMNRPIFESLSQKGVFNYKPTWMMKTLKLTYGFARNTDHNKEEYGVMLYHHNRLIRPYEKVGYQKQPNDLGVGVIGVVEVDFLKPILNKQDFEKDEKYNATMSAIASTLNDYWNGQKKGAEDKDIQETSHTDWTWVQCHKCQKWRRMPDDASSQSLPEQWFCYMNPDPTHNRCSIQQEPEDENLAVETPTSGKASKIQMVKNCKQDLDFSKDSELLTKKAVLPERQPSQQECKPSSSREKDPSVEDMQKALMEAQKKEKTHRKRVLQIQKEKDQLEQQNQTLLQEVEKLQTTKSKTAELLKLAASLTSGKSPVSSNSGKGGKRKSSEQGGSGGKRADIKVDLKDDAADEKMPLAAQTSFLGSESCSSSDIDAAAFLTTSRSASSTHATNLARPKSSHFVLGSTLPVPSSSTSLRKSPTKTDRLASSSNTSMTTVPSFSRSRLSSELHGLDNVIDLTFEESSHSLEIEDIKPDVSKLNLAVERANNDQVKDSSIKKSYFVTHAKATFASDKNVKVEMQESTSKQKYELMHQRFKALQKNVHKLLCVLVEDEIDIGKEEDIEDTVVEMIRVTCAPVKKA